MRRQKPPSRTYSNKTFLFMAIAVCLMVLVNMIWPERGLSVEDARRLVQASQDERSNVVDVEPQAGGVAQIVRSARVREPHNYPLFAEYYPGEVETRAVQEALKPSYRYALKNPGSEKVRIAIMIDDVGMNRTQSRAVVDMDDVPLTLAFLPYAPDLKSLTEPAQAAGHELMIHMPMEPVSSKVPLGPIAIKDHMNADKIREMLDKAYASFDGYVGLNNHMGSRVTQNKAVMDVVMDSLDERGLFYVDSKTISTSVAADAAREQGLRHAERDVFLDHEETLEFARGALRRLEKVALDKGYGIAIGHPKVNTVAALKEWLPTLEARGFEIVPVSELLKVRSDKPVTVAKARLKVPLKKKKKRFFMKKTPKLQDIEPAAGEGDAVSNVAAEDLLSAPIGVSDEFTDGLYSLSE